MSQTTNPKLTCEAIFNLAKENVPPQEIKKRILEDHPELVEILLNPIVKNKYGSLEHTRERMEGEIKHFDEANTDHSKKISVLIYELSVYFNEAKPAAFKIISIDTITERHKPEFIEFLTTLDILFQN